MLSWKASDHRSHPQVLVPLQSTKGYSRHSFPQTGEMGDESTNPLLFWLFFFSFTFTELMCRGLLINANLNCFSNFFFSPPTHHRNWIPGPDDDFLPPGLICQFIAHPHHHPQTWTIKHQWCILPVIGGAWAVNTASYEFYIHSAVL